MTTTPIRSAERRKAPRQARSLRISWRLLGNRTMRYGEAAIKDLSTAGLALQVDHFCPPGTVVIVQFEGVPEPFAEPMLLQTAWSSETQLKGGASSSYLVGCSFTAPLSEADLQTLLASAKQAAPAQSTTLAAPRAQVSTRPASPAPAHADPFFAGSAGEKRSVMRREGMTVPVILCRAGGSTSVEAAVVDRSLKGLGIVVRVPFTRGTILNVRPRQAQEKVTSVQVQVRNCREKGKQWQIGCHFLQSPPANVLMLLG